MKEKLKIKNLKKNNLLLQVILRYNFFHLQCILQSLKTLKKAKSSEKKVDEDDTQAPYKALNDKDKLLDLLKDKKKTNETLSRDIAKRTQLLLNSKVFHQ